MAIQEARPNPLETIEDGVRYTHRPQRRMGVQALMLQAKRAERNIHLWTSRLDASRRELVERRAEVVSQIDSLRSILDEIDGTRPTPESKPKPKMKSY